MRSTIKKKLILRNIIKKVRINVGLMQKKFGSLSADY